jgi:hypothetical protein
MSMTVSEALAVLEAYCNRAEERDRNHANRIIGCVKANGRVLPWMETEIRYLKVGNVRGGGVAVCAGGMAAEAAYNGCGSEEDISFGHAVANYERR